MLAAIVNSIDDESWVERINNYRLYRLVVHYFAVSPLRVIVLLKLDPLDDLSKRLILVDFSSTQ